MVRSRDDLVPFPDDPARIVARPDDRWRGSVTRVDSSPPDDSEKRSEARRAALEKALQHCLSGADGLERPRPLQRGDVFVERGVAERDLIEEITRAAAHDVDGDPIYRTDGIWRVVATVESSPYCLAIADLARALGVRKQTAHQLAHAAARAGVIDLAPSPQDRRILQVLVTPRGRAELAAAHSAERKFPSATAVVSRP
jgi:hypothetical protein